MEMLNPSQSKLLYNDDSLISQNTFVVYMNCFCPHTFCTEMKIFGHAQEVFMILVIFIEWSLITGRGGGATK